MAARKAPKMLGLRLRQAQGAIGLIVLAAAGEAGLYWLAIAGGILTLDYILETTLQRAIRTK